MTTARGTEGWTAEVRRRLAPGRLLPLGEAADGAWLAERAARAALRRAAAGVPGAVLDAGVRIGPAEGRAHGEPVVEPPPSALPPGPLRIDARFTAVGYPAGAATAGESLPAVAERLRAALSACAREVLGLTVTEVDLRVTGLLAEVQDEPAEPVAPLGGRALSPDDATGRAVAAVPGVAYLTGVLGAPVVSAPGQVRVELATAAGHHPPAVARAVRAGLTRALPGAPSVAVLVTAVEAAPAP
ncbi:hypothetical protein [Streptomyces corynorhini]|uniref:Nucleopolyhedrovirus P10 family protein n=1 Tax=Streptomyces corynorhini TaxID=2282652 RepID=A0A370BC30_9ACTN|nr:hypothetical protein [Streptomyces corynorhini]RDG39357.1 hypothetical protein DVH02_04340 [Streptomyces corynorhini]